MFKSCLFILFFFANVFLNCNWYTHLYLQDNVSALHMLSEAKEEEHEVNDLEEETLPSALLEEKNQEIDHLNNEIQRLEQELEKTRDAKVRVGLCI